MAIIQITNKRERKGLTFTSKIWLERNLFLKVFEEFDGIVALSNGVFRRVQPPHKFKGRAKRLVTEGHGRVYDVLSIATNHHKPANRSRPIQIILLVVLSNYTSNYTLKL